MFSVECFLRAPEAQRAAFRSTSNTQHPTLNISFKACPSRAERPHHSAILRRNVLRSRLLPLSGILAAAAAWQLGVSLHPSSLIPGPLAVTRGIVELAGRGLLVKYVVASLFRVTWGYLTALVIAVPLGLALGMRRRAETAIN